MKKKIKEVVPFFLLGMLLFIMYGTKAGVPGITQYWSNFELFDMRINYSTAVFRETMEHIGIDGIRHYLYYFVVDVGFIIVLLWIQCELTQFVVGREKKLYFILMMMAITRGVLDILEDSLLTLVMVNKISDEAVPFISVITFLKLLCLFIWGVIISFMCIRKKFFLGRGANYDKGNITN